MALVLGPRMKHTHGADILFPEDAPYYYPTGPSDQVLSPPASAAASASRPVKYPLLPERLLSAAPGSIPSNKYTGYENVKLPVSGGRHRLPAREQFALRSSSGDYTQRPTPGYPVQQHHKVQHANNNKVPGGFYNVRQSDKCIRESDNAERVRELPPSGRPTQVLSRSDSRRRTWSPPAFTRAMGTAALRSYHSNEQLDAPDEEENIYEDLDAVRGPPRLTPVSGRLAAQNASGQLIKPIAFKPIAAAPANYVSSPQQMTSPGHVISPRLMTSPGRSRSPSCGSNAADGDSGSQTYCASLRSIHSSPGSLNSSVNSAAGSHGASSPSHSQNYGAAPSPAVYGTMPPRGAPCASHNHSQDDGYASQPDFHSHTNSTASAGSYSTGEVTPMAVTYVSDFQSHMKHRNGLPPTHHKGLNHRSDSHTSLATSQMSVNTLCSNHSQAHTPSPSDSVMSDVETVIREKDAELDRLRRTMERNEHAILQVCAEKSQNWAIESQELTSQWERRLRAQQQKSFRTEQGLLMQIFKLQQERKSLRSEIDQLRGDRDSSDRNSRAAQDETQSVKEKLDDTQWQMQQKIGEISHLKNNLRETQEQVSNRDNSLLQVKAQLAESKRTLESQSEEITVMKAEAERHKEELEKTKEALSLTRQQLTEARAGSVSRTPPRQSPSPHQSPDKDALITRLKSELDLAKSEVDQLKASFKTDKEQWIAEKNKVILYQKHLQLNYMQMQRKNKMLEADIEQLTLELENRDFQLNDSPEAEESIC